jgi:hypothetical protein
LQGEEWRHVFRDVWAHTQVADTIASRIAAARLVLGPEGFLCGLTAAWVYGIDVQDRRGQLVWVGRQTGSWRRARSGCLVREITVEADDLARLEGTLITTPVRTAFDCARWLRLSEAVVVADSIAHEGLMNREAFAAYVRAHRKLRGVVQADQVASLLEPLSESPMESRVRVLMVASGFDVPVSQYVITDRGGRFVARVDFAYPERRIVIEYDGALHWEQRTADERRREAIRSLGWRVLVVSRSDYYDNPQAFLSLLRHAFGAAA